jgi:cyanophycinase
MCFGGAIAGAAAADNILGLPTPRDSRHPGAVLLHGGGRMTDDVFARFVELAGGRQARIVLVPSAGNRASDYDNPDAFLEVMKSRYAAWASLASHGRIQSFQFLYSDDDKDADDPGFVQPLESATGVWFSGGRQSRLNYRFVGRFPQKTRFQTALAQVVERGGVVGGSSAGMAALPEIITLWQDKASETAPAIAVTAHGFGLLTGAIVDQHFDARGGRLERFTGLLRNAPLLDTLSGRKGIGVRMLGLAAEEGTALVVQGDRLQVLGAGSVHVFVKSEPNGHTIVWHELFPGDQAQLTADSSGVPVLRREPAVRSR